MPCWVSPPRPSSLTPASRRSRGPRPTRRCWPHTPRTPRSPPARPRSRAPSTQSSRSSPPCSFPAAELLTRRPGRASQLGSVVRNLHFVAPLSAALANGDDTLSITADCYSTAGTDAAITAALLAYYTSSQVDTLLGDYRTGTAQDAETTSAITGALLAYYTAAQVDALLGDYRTASAQDTQTQAAIAGALLAYRTGPDQDVFTTNQITSALVAYRSAADQDTATASSIAAALLSYYTIAQVDGLLAGKLGVTEAASALQIAVRCRHRRADPGPHGRLALKLDGSPQQRLQRGPGHAHRSKRGRLHPDPGGEPVEHRAHLQLDARARAALRLPPPARHGLQLRGVHVRGRQRLRPLVRQLRGRPGRLEHGQDVLHSAAQRS